MCECSHTHANTHIHHKVYLLFLPTRSLTSFHAKCYTIWLHTLAFRQLARCTSALRSIFKHFPSLRRRMASKAGHAENGRIFLVEKTKRPKHQLGQLRVTGKSQWDSCVGVYLWLHYETRSLSFLRQFLNKSFSPVSVSKLVQRHTLVLCVSHWRPVALETW